MSRDAIEIGLLGFGTVGSGVVKIIEENGDLIRARLGVGLHVGKALVRDPAKPREVSLKDGRLTTRPEDILEDPGIRIVVEVMGGIEPARSYMLRALSLGKHVVTANKEVMARHGGEILQVAREHGARVRFEASVAGGIPIIKSLEECLAADRIRQIMGIINGTSNYVLTEMSVKGKTFEEALADAQSRGYAEADPSADVEGLDAANKLAILASIAFGTSIGPEDVYTEGITRITPLDIEYAKELGYVIKLLGIAGDTGGRVEARVHPTFIPFEHPLAFVNGVFNAILVEGNAVGDLMLYGRGAGDLPTGSAVVSDIIDIARRIDHPLEISFIHGFRRAKPVANVMALEAKYYIRFLVVDRPGVLASIAGAFGRRNVSLSSVIQKERGQEQVGLVFITHEALERNVREALGDISELAVVKEVCNVIRVE